MVAGDSHGNDLFNLFFLNKKFYDAYEFAYTNSLEFSESNLKFKNSDFVILSNSWEIEKLDNLKKLIDLLIKFEKKVILASQNVTFPLSRFDFTIGDDFINKISRLPNIKEKEIIGKNFYKKMDNHEIVNQELRLIAKNKNIKYLNKYDYLCSKKRKTCEFITDQNSKIYFDEDHYTVEGAKYLGKKYFKINNGQIFKE